VLVRGLSMTQDDEELLTTAAPLFNGLYEYRCRAMLTGGESS
jgi:hypothetical protein